LARRRSKKHEALHGEVRLGLMIAQERDHAPTGQLLDRSHQGVSHRPLQGAPHLKHDGLLASGDQGALRLREGVLEHDGYQVPAHHRAGLRRPAAEVVAEQLHDRIRDRVREHATRMRRFLADRAHHRAVASFFRAHATASGTGFAFG
jgi:hypothetical protein